MRLQLGGLMQQWAGFSVDAGETPGRWSTAEKAARDIFDRTRRRQMPQRRRIPPNGGGFTLIIERSVVVGE